MKKIETVSGMRALDCQSFAGAFTLGVAQAGFEIAGKREGPAAFGWPLLQENIKARRLVVSEDFSFEASQPASWSKAKDVCFVFGNPPCTAFSLMSGVSNKTGNELGANHRINSCMWDLVRLAASMKVPVVAMESVQGAYRQGRALMQALRQEMEELTGEKYDLTHALHNNASVGGASIRKRYFMVLSRRGLRFGIDPPVIERVPLFDELLHDLEPLELRTGAQPYLVDAIGAGAEYRSKSGLLDGHAVVDSPVSDRIAYVAANEDWLPGETMGEVSRRLIHRVGYKNLPEVMFRRDYSALAAEVLSTSAFAPKRWHGDRAARVIMSYSARDVVHPHLPRSLTIREVARIIGYPDDWSLAPVWRGSAAENQKWFGKGVSVPCGAWVAHWARAALEDRPGWWRGELIGEDEWLIDVTQDHKAVYAERSGEARDSRSAAQKREMESRKPEASHSEPGRAGGPDSGTQPGISGALGANHGSEWGCFEPPVASGE